MVDRLLTFRIKKSEYLRLSKIVRDLLDLSELDELKELDTIICRVVYRAYDAELKELGYKGIHP